VFGNSMLRRIFGLKRNEVTGAWRKLYNERLCNLCSSPRIIKMVTSRRMSWAENVAHTVNNAEYREDFSGKSIRNKTTRETKT
jgi:hypothetical protein